MTRQISYFHLQKKLQNINLLNRVGTFVKNPIFRSSIKVMPAYIKISILHPKKIKLGVIKYFYDDECVREKDEK